MSPQSWRPGRDRLDVRIGAQDHRVPEPIESMLLDAVLTTDVAADLFRLDATLITLLRSQRAHAEAVAGQITRLRARRDCATKPGSRRGATPSLDDLLTEHCGLVEKVDDLTVTREVLHEFVIGLDAPDGPLREAADGWRCDPAPPATVEVILDEYLAAELDERRARRTDWGGTALAGVEEWGAHWRRDPDDEPSEIAPYNMTGTWALGYLPGTTEIYAVRRTLAEPHTFWILGTGFTDPARVTNILTALLPRMRGPNSLLLAAEHIRTIRLPALLPQHAETG